MIESIKRFLRGMSTLTPTEHKRAHQRVSNSFSNGVPSVFNLRGIADATLKMRPAYTLEHLVGQILTPLEDFIFKFGALYMLTVRTEEIKSVEGRPVIWISLHGIAGLPPATGLRLLYVTIDSTTPQGYASAFPGTDVSNIRPVLMRLDGDDVRKKLAPLLDRQDVHETLATFALKHHGLPIYHVARASAELEVR